ncbi:MAG: HTH domain-containing protein, partial [Burkholderiaceae bacterium]
RDARDTMRAWLVQVMARDHQGRAQGISAAALASKVGISERMLRHLISDAREDGVAIVGVPESGYFIAQNGEELEQCCNFLRSRAMHSLVIEARLRKVALPELLGQLKVAT